MAIDSAAILSVNGDLEKASALERVRWAAELFGDELVLSSSFGIQAAVMLHLVNSVVPGIPVIFIDTGYLFPETYRFAEKLRRSEERRVGKEYRARWGRYQKR